MGRYLESRLRERISPLPFVGDVRGRGLFWAVEFVQNHTTKESFAPQEKFCSQVVDVALDLGLNILGNLGRTGAINVEHVIVSPPYIVTESDVDKIVDLLQKAISIVAGRFHQ